MAVEQQLYDDTFESAQNLTDKQYHTVKLLTGEKVGICTNTADSGLGVLQNKPDVTHGARVRLLGLSKAWVDGLGTPIVVGDYLCPSGNGRLVKTVADNYCAIAREACAVDAVIITVEVVRPTRTIV